jgi:transcription initiation factor TFIIIB Brf1 subunit/transcription initiation factor TFIIB
MDGNAIGKALAAAIGDLRDWPAQCLNCRSERLFQNFERHSRHCDDCGMEITEAVLYDDREQRAEKETGIRRRSMR